jgi:hypothetical protein
VEQRQPVCPDLNLNLNVNIDCVSQFPEHCIANAPLARPTNRAEDV